MFLLGVCCECWAVFLVRLADNVNAKLQNNDHNMEDNSYLWKIVVRYTLFLSMRF